MDLSSLMHLKPESKIKLPNVDEALNIGYALHSADDPALKGRTAQQNARIVVEKFLALEVEPDTPEEAISPACAPSSIRRRGASLAEKSSTAGICAPPNSADGGSASACGNRVAVVTGLTVHGDCWGR